MGSIKKSSLVSCDFFQGTQQQKTTDEEPLFLDLPVYADVRTSRRRNGEGDGDDDEEEEEGEKKMSNMYLYIYIRVNYSREQAHISR